MNFRYQTNDMIPETFKFKSDKKVTRSFAKDKLENGTNIRRSLPE